MTARMEGMMSDFLFSIGLLPGIIRLLLVPFASSGSAGAMACGHWMAKAGKFWP